jgi:hypothetical protein
MKDWGFVKPPTVAALYASIEKWHAVSRGEANENGIHDCPLCALFLKDSCAGCPVFEDTGMAGCDAAPYELDWAPLADADGVRTANTPEKVAAAEKIVAHLRALLAKEQA